METIGTESIGRGQSLAMPDVDKAAPGQVREESGCVKGLMSLEEQVHNRNQSRKWLPLTLAFTDSL